VVHHRAAFIRSSFIAFIAMRGKGGKVKKRVHVRAGQPGRDQEDVTDVFPFIESPAAGEERGKKKWGGNPSVSRTKRTEAEEKKKTCSPNAFSSHPLHVLLLCVPCTRTTGGRKKEEVSRKGGPRRLSVRRRPSPSRKGGRKGSESPYRLTPSISSLISCIISRKGRKRKKHLPRVRVAGNPRGGKRRQIVRNLAFLPFFLRSSFCFPGKRKEGLTQGRASA